MGTRGGRPTDDYHIRLSVLLLFSLLLQMRSHERQIVGPKKNRKAEVIHPNVCLSA